MTRSRIAFITLILSLIAATLWLNIPNLIGFLITTALKDNGVTHVNIKVSDVGWQQGKIQYLRFNKLFAQRELQVDARDLTVHYSWARLVNGQLNEIKLPATTVTVMPANITPDEKASFELPAFTWPATNQLPVEKLVIDKLTLIHQHSESQQDQVQVSGSFQKQLETVTGQLVFQQQGQPDLKIDLGMQQQHINLAAGAANSAPWMSLRVDKIDSKTASEYLQLKSHIDLAKFTQLIQAWGYVEELAGVAGDFQCHIRWPAATSITSIATEQAPVRSKLQATVQVTLNLSIDQWQGYVNDIAAHLDGQATINNDSIQWTISNKSFIRSQPDIKSMSAKNQMLEQILAGQQQSRLYVDFPQGLSSEWQLTQTESFTINDVIRFAYQRDKVKPLVKGTLKAVTVQLKPEWNIQTRYTTQLNLKKTGIPAIKSINTVLAGQVNIVASELTISIDKNATATVVPAKQVDFDLAAVQMQLTRRADCQLNRETTSAQCKQLAMTFGTLKYVQGVEHVTANSAELTLNNVRLIAGEVGFKADMVMKGIHAANEDYAVKLGDLKANLIKTAAKLQLNGELLTLNGDIQTQYAMDYYYANGKGLLEFELLPIDFLKQKKLFTRLLSKGRLPVKLQAGTFTSHGRIKWETIKATKKKSSDNLRIYKQIHISVKELAGSYQKTGFIGLQSRINLAGVDVITTLEPVRLQLNKLDMGVILSDIRMNAGLQFKGVGIPVIDIHTLNAKVLGGEMEGKAILLDLERSHNPFVININKLDLSKLLAWQQVEGVSGTGLLDIRLPLDLTEKGLVMEHGEIVALSPGGKLRYNPDERVKNMAQTNSNIKMLLEALNNFIYSQLTAKSDYSPDGKLVLDVALSGKNPNFQQGKTVNLNINIEENLLKLLQSLQLGDDISKKIADQLQQQK